jgi:uncharacterized membrane protein YagU involved in acid resistance
MALSVGPSQRGAPSSKTIALGQDTLVSTSRSSNIEIALQNLIHQIIITLFRTRSDFSYCELARLCQYWSRVRMPKQMLNGVLTRLSVCSMRYMDILPQSAYVRQSLTLCLLLDQNLDEIFGHTLGSENWTLATLQSLAGG